MDLCSSSESDSSSPPKRVKKLPLKRMKKLPPKRVKKEIVVLEKKKHVIGLKYSELRKAVFRSYPNLVPVTRNREAYEKLLFKKWKVDPPNPEERKQLQEQLKEEQLKQKPKPATKNRRSVHSVPSALSHIKDDMVSRKFKVVGEQIRELQSCTTWPQRDRDGKPKFHPIMMVYDEMVEVPRNVRSGNVKDYFRVDYKKMRAPKLFFLVPEDFEQAEFGNFLQTVGKDMSRSKESCGSNWAIGENVEQIFHLVYGQHRAYNPQGMNKQKKQKKKA